MKQFSKFKKKKGNQIIHFKLLRFACRWGYKCMDMQSSLQTVYIGSNYQLQEVYLYKDGSGEDFYVDVVYIGKTATSMDSNGKPLN